MVFIEEKHKYHLLVKYWFLLFLKGAINDMTLEELRKTKQKDKNTQWAKIGWNIIRSTTDCPQRCRYCYEVARKNRLTGMGLPDYESIRDIEDLGELEQMRERFVVDENRVRPNWTNRRKPKLWIFGSTHDIFPEMVNEYIVKVRNMVQTGSEVLIVTKPRLDCMRAICEGLNDVKNGVMIICTITSNDDEVLKYWEPFAPRYEERKECLKLAFEAGYRTSVSMEPYLSDPRPVVADLKQFVTHCIWLGNMNHCRELEFDEEEYGKLGLLYTPEYVRQLILDLWNEEKVFYKYGMMGIMGLKGKK